MTTEVALFDYEATSTLLDHALVSAWHWAEPKRFSKGAEKLLFPRRTSNISARESERRKSSSRLFLDLGHLIISVLQIAEVTRHVYYTFHSVCLVHIRSGGVTMVVPQGFSAEQIGKTVRFPACHDPGVFVLGKVASADELMKRREDLDER
ncbi:unnamed protein product [Zymoseptoria tritici ST99CH_3D1]|nr:unnamed protein product [Zymoseptoria tritici ST99CH_3D1]